MNDWRGEPIELSKTIMVFVGSFIYGWAVIPILWLVGNLEEIR